MIVVDFEAPDRIRATARFETEAVSALGAGPLATSALTGAGHLAMTIDQGISTNRYQGVVALDGSGLEAAAQMVSAGASASIPRSKTDSRSAWTTTRCSRR